ncbi:hypothetical protein HK097_009662 [Rhizophlyctis rosea]|uniref:non-specific serine/threonine protein kinase n=1 Tax=Rhizophlyctis rosea TaxID=64517 RepID=A0AAD5SHR8_9FUNG|nr:hypothetical protein HK097_009662 [Rhizophlyctis rosea]
MAAVEFSSHLRPRLEQISTYVSNDQGSPSLTLEALLDTFLALYTDCKNASNQPEPLANFLKKYDKVFGKLQNLRINTHDFEVVKTLATGAVGRVCLVRYKLDSKVYAMKVLKKTDLLTRREAGFFMEERDALVFAKSSDWITTLYAAFQDEEHLYLVMEYASGGSLRALMNSRDEVMSEEEAKFYVAEILLALEELHKHDFIHRDVKPENCLIDASGHVKLADFGSCIRIGQTRMVSSNETVGTPDYISPEILRAHEGNVNYGREVDWWSLGIIMYELFYDEVPFYADSLAETYGRIMDHEKHFAFPDDSEASEDALDLMRRLICKKEDRLGRNGADELKKHKWFAGFDWENARKGTRQNMRIVLTNISWIAVNDINQKGEPPFVPELSGPDDTRYFEDEENEMKKVAKKALPKTRDFAGQNLPFIGYTYIQNATAAVAWQTTAGLGRLTSGKNFPSNGSLAQAGGGEGVDAGKLKEAQEEIRRLKASLEGGMGEAQGLKEKVTGLENERSKLEADLKHLKTRSESDSKERDELEGTLSDVRKNLEKQTKENAELRKTVEEAEKVRKEFEAHKAEAQRASVAGRSREGDLEELKKNKESLEGDILDLKASMEAERKQRIGVTEHLKIVTQQLMQETLARKEAETEKGLQVSKVEGLGKELEAVKGVLGQEKATAERLTQANMQLAKDRAVVEVELEAARREVEEVKAKSDGLVKEVAALRSQQQSATGAQEAMETTRKELEKASAAHQRASDELSRITKSKALLDVELSDVKKQLHNEVSAHASTKTSYESAEQLVAEQRSLISNLEDSRKKLESQITALETDLQSARQSLETESTAHTGTKSSLLTLEQFIQKLTTDLRQSRSEVHQSQEAARKQYETSRDEIDHLHSQLDNAKKEHQKTEDLFSQLQTTHETLQTTHTRLQRTLKTLQSDHEHALCLLQSDNTTLQTTLTTEQNLRKTQENLNRSLTSQITDLETRLDTQQSYLSTLESDYSTLQKNYDASCYRIEELDAGARAFDSRAQSLHEKIHELENLNSSLHAQLDALHVSSDEKRAKSLENVSKGAGGEKGGVMERQSRTARLRNVFFKTPVRGQGASMELISEGEDSEGRKHGEGGVHMRSSTTSSAASMLSSLSTSIPVFVFDPNEGLRGYLKLPKDGKVKKGWRRVYAVVKDFKIFLYEKEKDVDGGEGSMVFDIRCDIFVPRPVQQSELIHASGKDIDCIFKIHAASVGVSSNTASIAASTLTSTTDTTAIQRKIAKLTNEIALEEKMINAAERMWGVSTEAQRQSISQQIQASHGRLKILRGEFEKQKGILAGIEGDGSSAASVGSGSPMTPAFSFAHDQEEDLEIVIQQVEAQLEDERKKRDAVLRMNNNGGGSTDKLSNRRSAKDSLAQELADSELVHAEKCIAKLNDDLTSLRSGNKDRIAAVMKRIKELNEDNEWFGHLLKLRQYYKPADCAVCHEALWGNKNQGLECTVCKLICHKQCKALIENTCQDVLTLKNAPAKYFMAEDPRDKARWLAGLTFYREQSQKSGERATPTAGVPVIGRARSATLGKVPSSPLKPLTPTSPIDIGSILGDR